MKEDRLSHPELSEGDRRAPQVMPKLCEKVMATLRGHQGRTGDTWAPEAGEQRSRRGDTEQILRVSKNHSEKCGAEGNPRTRKDQVYSLDAAKGGTGFKEHQPPQRGWHLGR